MDSRFQLFRGPQLPTRVPATARKNNGNFYFRTADYTHGIFQSIGFKEFHDYLLQDEKERQTELGKANRIIGKKSEADNGVCSGVRWYERVSVVIHRHPQPLTPDLPDSFVKSLPQSNQFVANPEFKQIAEKQKEFRSTQTSKEKEEKGKKRRGRK